MSGWTVLRRVMSARSKARVIEGRTPPRKYLARVVVAKVAARLIK